MQFTPSSGGYFNLRFIDTLVINAVCVKHKHARVFAKFRGVLSFATGFDIVFWVDDSLD